MNKEDKQTALLVLAIPGLLVFAILVMIVFGLYYAFIAKVLYDWFVLPLGGPELNIWHIWGLILLINVLKGFNTSKTDDDKAGLRLLGAILAGLLALGLGFVLKGLI